MPPTAPLKCTPALHPSTVYSVATVYSCVLACIECTMYVKVEKVYLPQQSPSLGESHPVPAQALPTYEIAQGRATEVFSLKKIGMCAPVCHGRSAQVPKIVCSKPPQTYGECLFYMTLLSDVTPLCFGKHGSLQRINGF